MSTASVPPPTTRAERKERTRQALLDAALELSADRGLGGLSLREVARHAGIVPTAFYRHFSSMDELGVTLAADTMRVLRRLLRDARRTPGPAGARQSLDVLVQQVRAHKAAFRFLARERHGGVPEVAAAISVELRLLTSELAADLGRSPGLEDWDFDDLEMAADLLVTAMLDFVLDLLAIERPGSAQEAEVVTRAEKQMRLILLGAAAWRPRRTSDDR
ncbi:transcriptional regulator, TetR family [Rhodococcus rhodochrous J3]|uniref:TetR family transcriptional regulator n=2 Tax=Rhodococcus rhodochrous TaxID=1829 RepID=A0AA47AE65_RHORH|nr:TetR family transcriptional regulator [Rhodococcus rhodochrous]MBF4476288.1 TetR family transcriptional regulator [Rhodococcus rhodochrous]MCB8912219.1 TetR family transcriptional regulator [Rhodococcus rhodochrous]MCD2095397.1 TetR family transcriptional regulator [Rhodococcus rhodochrous]MCD2120171.1 TetR family transcriptional regulator [Rhodococcus rhodochrous]MCQ4134448.1 TetR family transcriptional regulator [Rhodococcus rhodochrous]